jgi:ABC-2 type transport system ATP-binding protein
MKQRICIASALMSNPEVLLLDEPTTGLDPRGMSEVREIVKSLKGKSRLIFMSSHILSEVSEICDEVAMIDHGKLIVYDTISNVTAKFSGGNQVIEVGLLRPIENRLVSESIAKLAGVVSADRIDDKTFRVTYSGDVSIQERILVDLVALKIGVITFKPASSELEDVYLKLIKSTL